MRVTEPLLVNRSGGLLRLAQGNDHLGAVVEAHTNLFNAGPLRCADRRKQVARPYLCWLASHIQVPRRNTNLRSGITLNEARGEASRPREAIPRLSRGFARPLISLRNLSRVSTLVTPRCPATDTKTGNSPVAKLWQRESRLDREKNGDEAKADT